MLCVPDIVIVRVIASCSLVLFLIAVPVRVLCAVLLFYVIVICSCSLLVVILICSCS